MIVWTLALGALRALNRNLMLALLVALGVLVAVSVFARHYYNKGWAAHERLIAREIARVNAERAQLEADLARERSDALGQRIRSSEAAAREAQEYCRSNPSACGIEAPASSAGWRTTVVKAGTCGAVCSTPAGVREKLNQIR